MGIKIKKKRVNRQSGNHEVSDPQIQTVGEGPFAASTVNRHDGSIVVHRFKTEQEAQAQCA